MALFFLKLLIMIWIRCLYSYADLLSLYLSQDHIRRYGRDRFWFGSLQHENNLLTGFYFGTLSKAYRTKSLVIMISGGLQRGSQLGVSRSGKGQIVVYVQDLATVNLKAIVDG